MLADLASWRNATRIGSWQAPNRPRNSRRRPNVARRNHGEGALLASAYATSLEVAEDAGARTVAFPSISTGVSGYPIELAAEIDLSSILAKAPDLEFSEVRLVLFSGNDLHTYERVLRSRTTGYSEGS